MSELKETSLLNEIAGLIELPTSAYQKAEQRYKDLGDWFCRNSSSCKEFSPHIFPQGSFRLGTAIKPIKQDESFDLDLGCKLREGVTKQTFTQEAFKEMIGKEVKLYRLDRGIEKEVEEKKRCWTLEYKDQIGFHMDIVPCIPENENQRQLIKKSILIENNDEFLATAVSELTVSITDNTLPSYKVISDKWGISNPEGYARWFESRMRLAESLLNERAKLMKSAKIDQIPSYDWKTPLQMCIQLLKRHRDVMYIHDPEVKPISIIITTLAASAYRGELSLEETINNLLLNMESYIRAKAPKIPNPVNPGEDFSDKWGTEKGKTLNLQGNFEDWLLQAKVDFSKILTSKDPDVLLEVSKRAFGVSINRENLLKKFGSVPIIRHVEKPTEIKEKASPWRQC